MAWGARNEDGTWRLCRRKGATVLTFMVSTFPNLEIRFSSQAKAKACADALNEAIWPLAGGYGPESTVPRDVAVKAATIIHDHGGFAPADWETLRKALGE